MGIIRSANKLNFRDLYLPDLLFDSDSTAFPSSKDHPKALVIAQLNDCLNSSGERLVLVLNIRLKDWGCSNPSW
jgi:hypothetical protein